MVILQIMIEKLIFEISFNLNSKVLGEESEPQPLFDESLVKIAPPAGVEVQQVGRSWKDSLGLLVSQSSVASNLCLVTTQLQSGD